MEENNKIIKKENKYICEKCKFKSNVKAHWEAHIKTSLHLTGERKKRVDIKEPFKCEKCEYSSKNKINVKQHYLNEHGTKEEREREFKYYCKECDNGTFSIDLYNRHINTEKHKKKLIRNKIEID